MANKVNSYCTACGEDTHFNYYGEEWVCLSCGSINTQGKHNDPDSPYTDEVLDS